MRALMTRIAIGAALAAAASLGGAQGVAAQEAAAAPEVTYRKTVMQLVRQHREALTAVAQGQVPNREHAVYHASALRTLAVMTGDIYLIGGPADGSRALPAVWENAAGFAERVQAFREAAEALETAAGSGDADALNGALRAYGQTCAGCHMDFRGPGN